MDKHTKAQPVESRPAIEWVVGIISAVLVCALVLFLVYQAVVRESQPPELSVAIEQIEPHGTQTRISIAIRNHGDKTASAVTVLAVVNGRDDRKHIEFDYVPGQAIRRGAFVFGGSVSAEDVRLEISGYVEP